jgi:hypothetical protein
MRLIMSLSLATRMVLGALAIGFLVGTAVGYQAGETANGTDTSVESPDDVRALLPSGNPGLPVPDAGRRPVVVDNILSSR